MMSGAELRQKSKGAKDKDSKDINTNPQIPEVKPQRGSWFQQFLCYLFEQDDASYLAVFRILWGLIMLQEVVNHITLNYAKLYETAYQNPYFQFKYYGLDFGAPPSFEFLQWLMWLMAVMAICIIIGLFYRLASIGFAAAFIYFYATDATFYLNHFYLVAVMAMMLCFLPCNVYFSLDSIIWPSIKRDTVPK
jgi:vitamin K-dependent gamma-carboxylase